MPAAEVRSRLLAAALLLALPLPARTAGAKADPDTVKLVELFLRTETKDLPAELVPHFMQVDPQSLPARLEPRFVAKRAELDALKRLADGAKAPPLRRLGKEDKAVCKNEILLKNPMLLVLFKMMGFIQITEDELLFLMDKTKCNECEMQEEFSLTVIRRPKGQKRKKDEPDRWLFLHPKDPIMAYVDVYRSGSRKTTGTDFFGVGLMPACR